MSTTGDEWGKKEKVRPLHWNFPGSPVGPVVKTPPPQCRAAWYGKKKKKMTTTFYKYSSNNDYFRDYVSCCVNKEKAYCFQMSQFGERE